MNDLFSTEWLANAWSLISDWVLTNVLVVGNAIQLLVVVLTLGVAVMISRRLAPWLQTVQVPQGVRRGLTIVAPLLMPLAWFSLLWLSISAARTAGWPFRLLEIVASLVTAWVAIRLVSQIVRNPVWSRVITWTAWSIAALNILGLLQPTITLLDSAAITIGALRVSLYTVAKSTFWLAVLLSISVYLTSLLESRIRTSRTLSPSVQVLFTKSLKIVLISLAILISIDSVGIDLTALAVFGGAIGVGVGFGLQKVISNLISGVILLIDKSIKPGDVIAVSGTYGWVTALGGRYVSVVTRDGIEHLIPNEILISERVENWTHTNSRTRLKIDVGIHYNSEVRAAMQYCLDAAADTERVLKEPEPKCMLIEFGDNSVNLQLRFWIADAQNGVQNVKSAVLLTIWDKFKEHGVEIPYPQRDLHLRSGGEIVARQSASNGAT
jgi:small-conductance mechanosensitive channel